MLLLLSPSKTLDFSVPVRGRMLKPVWQSDACLLASQLCVMSESELASLLGVSKTLAALNYARYQAFLAFPNHEKRQAISAFRGDVYDGLGVDAWGTDAYAFADDHVRILSGLYGLLRPRDAIAPYRLDMGVPLANAQGKNLYAFWGARIAERLNHEVAIRDELPVVIQLASHEYFKAVSQKVLQARVVTPVFKEKTRRGLNVVMLFAKRARGRMADFYVRESLDRPEGLKDFDADGYRFVPALSSDNEWVFVR